MSFICTPYFSAQLSFIILLLMQWGCCPQTKSGIMGISNCGTVLVCGHSLGSDRLALSFLSFLTILPTYFGKILPVLHPVDKDIKMGNYEQLAIDFWQDVPFFDFTISPTTFTFLMQGLLILTLLVTAYRKWRNQALPAFSKSSGLLLFIVLQFLLLGSLWTFFANGEASGLDWKCDFFKRKHPNYHRK